MKRAIVFAVFASFAFAGCGKKGPPLPPLVKLPAPPAELVAERRGGAVDLQFGVPAANTDNTRPANIGRVDVYAITSPEAVTPDQIIKRGARVATVEVKAPRDPNRTIDEDESAADMEPPEGRGLDQGALAHLSEQLTGAALTPVNVSADSKNSGAPRSNGQGPLLPPTPAPLARTYVAVGVSTRDRKGAPSQPVAVPLVAPPSVPAGLVVTYDENAITLRWRGVGGRTPVQAAPEGDTLPSTPLGAPPPSIAYNVYDASQKPAPVKLTKAPVAEATFSDPRIVWGEERCYAVRAVEKIGPLTIESDAGEPECKMLSDIFAPAAPAGLQSSPLEGAVNLIWDASTEKDLAGYIVFRGPSADSLQPITESPIQVTTYLDKVPAGTRFTYAVKAVDRAGNASRLSNTVEEAAR